MTAKKFWSAERDRLHDRREALRQEAAAINARLTEIMAESALLDDLIVRLGAHLPASAAVEEDDVVPLRRERAAP